MVGEYLSDPHLFQLARKGKQNLAQLLYDWETRAEEEHYAEIKEKGSMRE